MKIWKLVKSLLAPKYGCMMGNFPRAKSANKGLPSSHFWLDLENYWTGNKILQKTQRYVLNVENNLSFGKNPN